MDSRPWYVASAPFPPSPSPRTYASLLNFLVWLIPRLYECEVLHGGCLAAALHHTAATHFATSPDLAALNQPDILTLHVDFVRPCELLDSSIVVNNLKVGAVTSTIQLVLSQKGKTRAVATATSINFDAPAGPSSTGGWRPSPPLRPVPRFDRVLAGQPDDNWIPACLAGEIIPFTRRMLALHPREGHPVDGVIDLWNGFRTPEGGAEPMDATYLALMADTIPSLSDTLLRNGGLYDAHATWAQMAKWSDERPGTTAQLTNSVKDLMRAEFFNNTVTLDIEFKRRVPSEGLHWALTRVATRMLEGGRMDLDLTILNEDLQIMCLARQVVLVLDAKKKFGGGGKKQSTL